MVHLIQLAKPHPPFLHVCSSWPAMLASAQPDVSLPDGLTLTAGSSYAQLAVAAGYCQLQSYALAPLGLPVAGVEG